MSSRERRGGGGGGAAVFAEGAFGNATAARATTAPRRDIQAAEGTVCGLKRETGKDEGNALAVRQGSCRRRQRTGRDGFFRARRASS